jgi:sulfite dehydrogenase (quinone) subunit SoeC
VHPALSVLFFTTLSGAGYGIAMWLGALLALEYLGGYRPDGALLLAWGASLGVAAALVAVGLTSSMLHLGKPGRAWRAFSQWRTSWLSREGVLAVVTFVPIFTLLGMIAADVARRPALPLLHTPLLPVTAAAMAACATATVVCTAMIYASLKPIPAWRHATVVPAYLAFALLTGAALLAVTVSVAGPPDSALRSFAAAIAASACVTAALKLAYWRAIDTQPLPASRGDALGLPGRDVTVFERPHTEDNYVTREMAFAVARRHARRLRTVALVSFAALPLAAAIVAWAAPAVAPAAFAFAALTALAGAFVERWLFFAEARHVVVLYY